MDLNYNSINLFPTIIHQFDVNGFSEIKDELIDYAYQFKDKDPDGVIYSNKGGWQSPNFDIKDEHIQRGITKISSVARLQEIKSGKLKELVKNNKLIIDGTHNEDGARALNEWLRENFSKEIESFNQVQNLIQEESNAKTI